MDQREIAEQIFLAGVESVVPDKLIAKHMAVKGNTLVIGDLSFSLETMGRLFVIGAGKACAMMAAEVEIILGNRIDEGQVVVKYGHSCNLKYIRVTEAGHPVPDQHGFQATESILKIAQKATGKDLVICLLSGGGSSLLVDCPKGVSPEELMMVHDQLIKSGATIEEINAVRKHLSGIKGGQLARAVSPATLVSLILSDVPGDPPDVIASGPTSPDPTTFQQALAVLVRYHLTRVVSAGIVKYLQEGERGNIIETPKAGELFFNTTYNLIVGTNRLALEAAKHKAVSFAINTIIADDHLQGDTSSIAACIVEMAVKVKGDNGVVKPVCLLFGGEPTLKVTGDGLGGRNQHLALLCAGMLQQHQGITILSAGTDGTDGPTNAAGAVVDSATLPDARSKNMDPAKYIETFDSWHFFEKAGGHIITGPTMTNVMDIIVVMVK